MEAQATVVEIRSYRLKPGSGPEWREGPREAIVSLIESDISVVIPADSLSTGPSSTERA